MQHYLKPLLAAYLLLFSYATAHPQNPQNQAPPPSNSTTTPSSTLSSPPTGAAAATTIIPTTTTPPPQSTGTTYTIYNASLSYYGSDSSPSTHFHLGFSGAKPGAALVSCNGQWTTRDSNQANPLLCMDMNADVTVEILVAGGMDVNIMLNNETEQWWHNSAGLDGPGWEYHNNDYDAMKHRYGSMGWDFTGPVTI